MGKTFIGQLAGAYTEVDGGSKILIGPDQASRVFIGEVGVAYTKVYEYDTAGPTVRTFTVTGLANGQMRFAWSGGALVTDAASGVASVTIEQRYTPYGGVAQAWAVADTLTQAEWEASSGAFDFTPPTTKRRQWNASYPYAESVSRHYMGFRVIATDAAGNSTTTAETRALTKPYGTVTVVPTSQDSYRAGWLGYASHAVRSGDSGSGVVDEYGCYFYGSALADRCDGYTPSSGRFHIQRYSTWGSSGTWNFQLHNLASKVGAATLLGSVVGVSVSGSNYSVWYTMASDWLTAIANGTGKGLALDSVTAWRVLYSWAESFSNSGAMELTFT